LENSDNKRLFFGLHIEAPWPLKLPYGRIIDAHFRHMTLAFLGECSLQKIQDLLPMLPKPPFSFAPTGVFEQVVFLPKRFSRVVAWQLRWMEDPLKMKSFYEEFSSLLRENQLLSEEKPRELLPHVTMARKPFARSHWKKSFLPLPLMATGLHLYESLGHSCYHSLWEHPFLFPFEEIPHTADLAYLIKGSSFTDLYLHAQIALCFKFPEMTFSLSKTPTLSSLDEVIGKLNEWICLIDQKISSPLKAISYHGNATENEKGLEWEMIVDV
jgi:RNA 2',3'-cyclic 3'-phosphodiesterase